MSRFLYIVRAMFKNREKTNYPAIRINDEQYPAQLTQIASPPEVLYVRGHIPKDRPMIGIVGTRRSTPYGKRVTEHIVKGLVRAGCTIVSGMAIGIDSEAHKAALEAGGETVAVVGSGIDESVVYPASNRHLAEVIETHGAVTSEFNPYEKSQNHFFPQRNRVISGLSLGVVVIEAKEKSGALITANFALEQNREVFAVPGSIFWDTSAGPNNLIKQGAKAVTCAEEILEELNIPLPDQNINRIFSKNPIERQILELLLDKNGAPMHIDAIIQKSKLSASQVSSAIVEMELNEKIKNLGGDHYVLA